MNEKNEVATFRGREDKVSLIVITPATFVKLLVVRHLYDMIYDITFIFD